jgi:imidazolonepropionase
MYEIFGLDLSLMRVLFKNIRQLLQIRDPGVLKVAGKDMSELPVLDSAYLITENDRIADYGPMDHIPDISADLEVDASGKMLLPAWCDSHTHLVYAGNREKEFVDRIRGLSYEEIASRGGGILNSAQQLGSSSEDQIFEQSSRRLEEIMKLGTGAVEIKSGYGLTTESELKMLRVIKRLSTSYPIEIKATFLGAHAFPEPYRDAPDKYVDLICDEMIPKVAEADLAEFIDAFCEQRYFSVDQTQRIMERGKEFGLVPKIHVNQFNSIGGIQAAIESKALTVDHLEVMTDADFRDLEKSEVMPVALPSCSYFLSIPYTPGREIIDRGMPLAIATDFNPGSTPSGNMNFAISTACIKMRLTPEEAINAATINGAYAMNLSQSLGSITKGKLANLILTREIPSYGFLPYAFGSDLIDKVMIKGEFISYH